MKTARFKQMVAACGQPSVYLTWIKPDKDPVLHKLVKAHRILTVHQALRGSAKDFGTVGFHAGHHVQILVFPKSLRRYAERKTVGIDYDLIETKAGVLAAEHPPKIPRPEITSRQSQARRVKTKAPRKAAPVPKGELLQFPAEAPSPRKESQPKRAAPEEPPSPVLPAAVARKIKEVLRDLGEGRLRDATQKLEQLVRKR